MAKSFFIETLIIVACIILLFIPGKTVAGSRSGGKSNKTGIITATKLYVRAGPGISKTSLKILKRGTKVLILKHCNGWLKILHKGESGYIRNKTEYVHIVSENRSKKNSDSGNIKQLETKAGDIGDKIEKHNTDLLECNKKEAAIISGLNDIDLSLSKTRKNIIALRSEIDDLGKKIDKTRDAANDLSEKIKKTETYALKRLVALYKLNQVGEDAYSLASAESMYELITRKSALERILQSDEKLLQNHMKDKAGFLQILATLNSEKDKRLSLESDCGKQLENMSRERAKREKILEDIRTKKSFAIAAVKSLKASRKTLNETIKSLKADVKPPKENESQTNKKNTKKTFAIYKGLLNMPVKGKILSFFGPYKNTKFNIVNFRSGIEIKADKGEPIQAVFSGRILYSGWFKGYGNMIIIDHGNHYYTLYAHAEELFKRKSDNVETGEVIATVGDTGSMTGPCLHFEVRHHGKPVDPLKWLKTS